MDEKLVIDVARLDPEGEDFEGEVACVDLDESCVKAFGTELLVRGSQEQDFDLVCSRCGRDFDDTVKVEDFTTSVESGEKTTEVDLTNELRESIILALPTYPVCSETCPGVVLKTQELPDERWNVLEKLKEAKKQGE